MDRSIPLSLSWMSLHQLAQDLAELTGPALLQTNEEASRNSCILSRLRGLFISLDDGTDYEGKERHLQLRLQSECCEERPPRPSANPV